MLDAGSLTEMGIASHFDRVRILGRIRDLSHA